MRPNPPGFPSCSRDSHCLPSSGASPGAAGAAAAGPGVAAGSGHEHGCPQGRRAPGGSLSLCSLGSGEMEAERAAGSARGHGRRGAEVLGQLGTSLVLSTPAPLARLLTEASRGGKAPIPHRREGGPSSPPQARRGSISAWHLRGKEAPGPKTAGLGNLSGSRLPLRLL